MTIKHFNLQTLWACHFEPSLIFKGERLGVHSKGWLPCLSTMEQRTLKNVNNCLNTKIYSSLEASVGQNYNLYLNVVHFSTPVSIIQLWQLKTVVFLHWCLIWSVLLLHYGGRGLQWQTHKFITVWNNLQP